MSKYSIKQFNETNIQITAHTSFQKNKLNLTVHYTHATVVVMHTENKIEHSSEERLTPRNVQLWHLSIKTNLLHQG